MDYIKAALALLFFPLFIGSMLLAAFWEKDPERVEGQESSENKETKRIQTQVPSKEKDTKCIETQVPSREGRHQLPIERERTKRRRRRPR